MHDPGPSRTSPHRTLLLCTGVLAAAAVVVVLRGVEPADAQPAPARDVGAHLYGRDCAGCHGAEGEGTPRGVALVGVGEASAHYSLVTGRMPLRDPQQTPRRGPPAYDDDEVESLVAHVAGFGDGPTLPAVDWRDADAAQGGVLYRLHCGACHGANAAGGALAYDRFAPTLHESEPSVVAAAVVAGPGAMPAFGPDGFTDAELADLVAYVQAVREPVDRGGWPIFRTGRPDEALVTWAIGIPFLLVAAGWIARRVR